MPDKTLHALSDAAHIHGVTYLVLGFVSLLILAVIIFWMIKGSNWNENTAIIAIAALCITGLMSLCTLFNSKLWLEAYKPDSSVYQDQYEASMKKFSTENETLKAEKANLEDQVYQLKQAVRN